MADIHDWHKDESTGMYLHDVTVMVKAPVETCFAYWSSFERFPRIMTYITNVEKVDPNTWHWLADIAGQHVSWDAVMTEFRLNEMIGWRAVQGLKNMGTVRFEPAGMGSCRITVHLMYDPPFGPVGDLVAERGLNDQFHEQLSQDLLNFKHAVESGQTERYRPAA